jgi:hypothetical protein
MHSLTITYKSISDIGLSEARLNSVREEAWESFTVILLGELALLPVEDIATLLEPSEVEHLKQGDIPDYIEVCFNC